MNTQIHYRFFFLSLLLFVSSFSIAQNIDLSNVSKKGIAYSNMGNKLRFTAFQQKDNHFTFTKTNKSNVDVNTSDIAKIDVFAGYRSGKFALIGAGVSILTFNVLYQLDRDENSEIIDEELLILVASGVVGLAGGLLGALIGLGSKKYKTVYTAPSLGNSHPRLQLKTTTPNAVPSLTFSYSF